MPSLRRPRSAATPGAGGLTSRAAVLALVVCGLVVSGALPLREFLTQRTEISELAQQQADQRGRVAALAGRQRQLQDPAYVRSLARDRLGFVLPGETAYVVLDPGTAGQPAVAAGPGARPARPQPWYSQLWGSVQAADRPPAR